MSRHLNPANRFPKPGKKKRGHSVANCDGAVKSWDCGCSFGCPQCWASGECEKCGGLFAYEDVCRPLDGK